MTHLYCAQRSTVESNLGRAGGCRVGIGYILLYFFAKEDFQMKGVKSRHNQNSPVFGGQAHILLTQCPCDYHLLVAFQHTKIYVPTYLVSLDTWALIDSFTSWVHARTLVVCPISSAEWGYNSSLHCSVHCSNASLKDHFCRLISNQAILFR